MPLHGHEAEIKRRIGYSTGTVSWYPRKKLREIAAAAKRFYPNWEESAYCRYRDLFQLDEEKTPLELSDGMKVKFNLLLALSHRAEILLLDEPTSGLDPFSRDELLEIFMALRAEGTAVFFSTHILSDLEKCADDILYISGGKIQAAMPPGLPRKIREKGRDAGADHSPAGKGETGMKNILKKEMTLSASILAYLFLPFGLLFLVPGYPILYSAFFVCLGIFQSFQYAREANDIVFSALLLISKQDVVKGKYLFVCLMELCSTLFVTAAVLLRMTIWKDASVYRTNAMMNANLFTLGMALVLFGLFNWIFVGGFFKTAYRLGKPFLLYLIAATLIIGVSEALHHIPGLAVLNSFGFDHFALQLSLSVIGLTLYIGITLFSYRRACRNFESIDL